MKIWYGVVEGASFFCTSGFAVDIVRELRVLDLAPTERAGQGRFRTNLTAFSECIAGNNQHARKEPENNTIPSEKKI